MTTERITDSWTEEDIKRAAYDQYPLTFDERHPGFVNGGMVLLGTAAVLVAGGYMVTENGPADKVVPIQVTKDMGVDVQAPIVGNIPATPDIYEGVKGALIDVERPDTK